jgi:hypothetical protein
MRIYHRVNRLEEMAQRKSAPRYQPAIIRSVIRVGESSAVTR